MELTIVLPGIIFNIISIYILSRKAIKTNILHSLFIVLATFDLIFLLQAICILLYHFLPNNHITVKIYFFHMITAYVCFCGSTYTTVMIAIERQIGVNWTPPLWMFRVALSDWLRPKYGAILLFVSCPY